MRSVARNVLVATAISLLGTVQPLSVSAQSAADSAAIRATALDYIMGYYEGDGARMERALHPHLAKRIVRTNAQGRSQLGDMTALELVQGTSRGGGSNIPAAERKSDVKILDIFQNAASVRIDAGLWIDYLQVAKFNGRWLIINVLWEERAQATPARGSGG
jgi:hypothetical protein